MLNAERLRHAAILILGVALSMVARERWQPLLAWLAVIWGVVCLYFVWRCRARRAKVVWFNLAAILLILAAAEGWLRVQDSQTYQLRQEFQPDGAIFVRDEQLGWRPQANTRVRSKGHYGDEQTYDVVYTFNEDGLRIGPPEPSGSDGECVLFFGCSFTFGEGVNDEEAMPYRVGVKMHRQVRNFGFRGYGPHHMLAAIEGGLVQRAAKCRPTHAVYWSMSHHIRRAVGKWSGDKYGPRYELQPDGSVRRNGSYADDQLRTQLIDSSSVGRDSVDRAPLTAADVALFLGIIDTSKRRLEADYPGLTFHVAWWDPNESPGLFTGWHERGIRLHRMMDALPFDPQHIPTYHLPHDAHPNAATHDKAAAYIVSEVLRR